MTLTIFPHTCGQNPPKRGNYKIVDCSSTSGNFGLQYLMTYSVYAIQSCTHFYRLKNHIFSGVLKASIASGHRCSQTFCNCSSVSEKPGG